MDPRLPSITMKNHSAFVRKLSLEEMARRTSVVCIWTHTDILISIEDFPFKEKTVELWHNIENKVKNKISELNFPEKLKRRMKLIVTPIGLQIPEWKRFMGQCLCDPQENLGMDILKRLCWTSAGSLDYAKTAEKLVILETLDIVTRFKIASEHCLADSLPLVWKELPKGYKSRFNEDLLNTDLIEKEPLQTYWAYVLMEKEDELFEKHGYFYAYAFASSVERGNKIATEYFFQKLDKDQRDYLLQSKLNDELQRLLDCGVLPDLPLEKNPDVFCYLFSQLTPEGQLYTLRENPGCLFRIFFHWPWQDFFLDKTDLFWNFPPDNDPVMYDDLLSHIVMKFEYSDYYFPELFQKFFCRSPMEFRKFFIDAEYVGGEPLMPRFILDEETETLKAIFRNVDAEGRFRLASCSDVFQTFDCGLARQDVVELCVREACPSKEDREKLKRVYMAFLILNRGKFKKSESEWQLFFESLDAADASCLKKRNLDDKIVAIEEESEAKLRKLH